MPPARPSGTSDHRDDHRPPTGDVASVDLSKYPPGSTVTVQGVVLTGYRHLIFEVPAAGQRAIKTVCGREGAPYVWKGSGLRATSQPSHVDCPSCIATPGFEKRLGAMSRSA